MKVSKEELGKKLLEVEKIEFKLKLTNLDPRKIHNKLLPEGIKPDKSYRYDIQIDKMILELTLNEKDGILFHGNSIMHVFPKEEDKCPFCGKGYNFIYPWCDILRNHLTDFLLFILKKHPTSRIKLLNDPIFQGKEIMSENVFVEKTIKERF